MLIVNMVKANTLYSFGNTGLQIMRDMKAVVSLDMLEGADKKIMEIKTFFFIVLSRIHIEVNVSANVEQHLLYW